MENARFINLIQQYPSLYDPTNKDYKDVEKKQAIWSTIADTYNLKDGSTARQKWKNLRDSYVKYLRDLKFSTGQKKGRYSNWIYCEQMNFLEPFIEFRKTTNGDSNLVEKPDLVDEDRSEEKEEFFVSPSYSEESDEDPLKEHTRKPRKRRRECKDGDDVDVFFSGLAKIVKKLPNTTQAKLKLQCSNLILNAELKYEKDRQRSVSPEFVSIYRISPTP